MTTTTDTRLVAIVIPHQLAPFAWRGTVAELSNVVSQTDGGEWMHLDRAEFEGFWGVDDSPETGDALDILDAHGAVVLTRDASGRVEFYAPAVAPDRTEFLQAQFGADYHACYWFDSEAEAQAWVSAYTGHQAIAARAALADSL